MEAADVVAAVTQTWDNEGSGSKLNFAIILVRFGISLDNWEMSMIGWSYFGREVVNKFGDIKKERGEGQSRKRPEGKGEREREKRKWELRGKG